MGKKNKQKQVTPQGVSPSANFEKSKVEKNKNLTLQTSFSEKKKKAIKQNFQVLDSTTPPIKSGDKEIVTVQNQNTSGSPKKRNRKRSNKFKGENVTNVSVSASAEKVPNPNKIEINSDKPLSKSARRRLKKQQSQKKGDEGKEENYIPLVSPTKSNTNGISAKKQKKNASKIQSKTSPLTKKPKITNTLPDMSMFSSASDDDDDDDDDEDVKEDDDDKIESDDNDNVESDNDDDDESDNEVNLKPDSKQQEKTVQIQSKSKEVTSPSKRKRPDVSKPTLFATSGNIEIRTVKNGPLAVKESSDEEDDSEDGEDHDESEEDDEEEVNVKDFVNEEAEEGEESDQDDEESEDDGEGSPQKKMKYSPTEERIKRSDDGDDENKVFINKLPSETTEEQLRQVLSKVGNINSVTLPRNKQNEEECRGFAFVTLSDKESVQKVLELDGVAEINGQPLSIREYTSRPRGGGWGGGGFRGGRGGGGFRGGRGGGGFRGGRGGGGFRGGRGGGGFRGGRGGGGFRGGRGGGGFRGGRDSGNFRGGRGGGFRGSPGGRGRGFKGGNDGASKTD